MKTVEDYKNLGLEFAEGDVLAIEKGGKNAGRISPVNATDIKCGALNKKYVDSFVWRKNTGEIPSYRGLVYVEFVDSHKDDRFDAKHWDWSLSKEGVNIIKCWKPVLLEEEQPENTEPNSYNRICEFMQKNKDKIELGDKCPEDFIIGLIAKKYDIDIRSERDKVVEEAIKMPLKGALSRANFARQLYDVGMLRMPEVIK